MNIKNISPNSSAWSASASRNSRIPTIPSILTSGQSKLSDAEFDEKIMDLARRDVAAGKNSRGNIKGGEEFFKLGKDYMSSASPDRKGMISDTLSNLANKLDSMRIKFNANNLLQVLFQNSRIFGNSGNFGNAQVGSNFVNFKDANGNIIASFDEHRGWVAHTTQAEVERLREFNVKWDKAIAKATQETNAANATRNIKA